MTCIREVTGSNFSRDTDYPEVTVVLLNLSKHISGQYFQIGWLWREFGAVCIVSGLDQVGA
jgi:hypothetical protein